MFLYFNDFLLFTKKIGMKYTMSFSKQSAVRKTSQLLLSVDKIYAIFQAYESQNTMQINSLIANDTLRNFHFMKEAYLFYLNPCPLYSSWKSYFQEILTNSAYDIFKIPIKYFSIIHENIKYKVITVVFSKSAWEETLQHE